MSLEMLPAFWLPVFATSMALAEPPAPRCEPTEEEPVTLAELWSRSRRIEPGYIAAEAGIQAERSARTAVVMEWIPRFSIDGLGNWGQRLSPSEERRLGAGPRGELRLSSTWTFLDSSRGSRARVAESRAAEAAAALDAFDVAFRGQVARLYVEAALADALWEVRSEQHESFVTLGPLVRQRIEAGVDVQWEGYQFDELLARSERLLVESARDRAAARAQLSALAGACVRPAPISPDLEGADAWRDAGTAPNAGTSPEVRRLLRLAETHDALARAESNRDRFQLQVLGSTGPTRSRAFTHGVENEYLVGLAGSWRPDLYGIQRQLAASEDARARAARAEAESRRLAVERELRLAAIELEFAGDRGAALARELEFTQRAAEAAVLRWREGVARWSEVIVAQERAEAVQLQQLELQREVALSLIRVGEATGRLDQVPRDLGQEGN